MQGMAGKEREMENSGEGSIPQLSPLILIFLTPDLSCVREDHSECAVSPALQEKQ